MIHAIVTTWALDEAKKREDLSNRCPKCGEQLASEKKATEPISCEKCGTEILPSENENLETKQSGQSDG